MTRCDAEENAGPGHPSPASLVAAPLLEDLLFNVNAVDRTVFGAVTVLLLGVAIIASALPSVRAARADPADALRTD